jgi:hypothetical protein
MLSSDSLANILLAVATGSPDRAADLIATSDEIDPETRSVLGEALMVDNDRSASARRLGDGLRSLGADRHLVNECYRVAFYAGEDWKTLSNNPLYAFFTANRAGYPLDKWIHYFPIFERHLERYKGLPVRVLEIGVYRGGGLEMLRHFLGPQARLVGIDNDEAARIAVGARYPVELGDQADPAFLRLVADKHGPFDVVIDDGGHTMSQQVASIETLFPLLAEGGTYLVEDCHTSYWEEYSDQGPDGQTFIEWVKERIDDLNAYHHSLSQEMRSPWQTHLDELHVYDGVVVFNKHRRWAPFDELTGTKEFINYNRDTSALQLELLATRDAAVARVAEAGAAIARASDVEARAAADIAHWELEIQGRRGDLVELRIEARALREDLDRLRTEHNQTCSDLLGSWGIIREMRRSMSWKVTAPLRRAKSLLGRR